MDIFDFIVERAKKAVEEGRSVVDLTGSFQPDGEKELQQKINANLAGLIDMLQDVEGRVTIRHARVIDPSTGKPLDLAI